MIRKELGKSYLVAFCKGCGAGFRIRPEPVPEGKRTTIAAPELHVCPGCRHRAEYGPADVRVARFQKEGMGRQKRRR